MIRTPFDGFKCLESGSNTNQKSKKRFSTSLVIRLENFRLGDFFVFDLRRSLSTDLDESCDFKLKKPQPKAYFMKKYHFSLKQPFLAYLKKMGQDSFFFA